LNRSTCSFISCTPESLDTTLGAIFLATGFVALRLRGSFDLALATLPLCGAEIRGGTRLIST